MVIFMAESKKFVRSIVLNEEEIKFFEKIKFKEWFFGIFYKAKMLKDKHRIDAEDILEDKINELEQRFIDKDETNEK